jgi:hypothetical protein
MKPLMMAALVVQLTSAGGAGSGRAGDQARAGSTPKDVGRHFSALKSEMSSLKQQFKAARERAKLDAERQRRESEGTYEPQAQPTAAPAAPSGGGSL